MDWNVWHLQLRSSFFKYSVQRLTSRCQFGATVFSNIQLRWCHAQYDFGFTSKQARVNDKSLSNTSCTSAAFASFNFNKHSRRIFHRVDTSGFRCSTPAVNCIISASYSVLVARFAYIRSMAIRYAFTFSFCSFRLRSASSALVRTLSRPCCK